MYTLHAAAPCLVLSPCCICFRCLMLMLVGAFIGGLLQGRKFEVTPLSMYNFFIERVKQNLHIVLAMSPIGDAFRNRLRMFPSLINCCTIDWFQVCVCVCVIVWLQLIVEIAANKKRLREIEDKILEVLSTSQVFTGTVHPSTARIRSMLLAV